MKVVLIGYMASGKSVIAKDLAKKLNLDYIDLDDYIEQKENQRINQIFKDRGEIYFRLKENKYLKEILDSNGNVIIATGGGTPCYANNMDLINKKSKAIYLKGAIDTLFERLVKEKDKRPLIKNIDNENLKEFIAKHLFERSDFYNNADFTINIDQKTIAEISDEIINLLQDL